MGKKKHRRRHAHGRGEDDSVSERSKSKGHRSKEAKVSKVGSYLSDYTKPVIIKRNEDGETTEEEDADDDMQGLEDDYDDRGMSIVSNRNFYYQLHGAD